MEAKFLVQKVTFDSVENNRAGQFTVHHYSPMGLFCIDELLGGFFT